MMLKLNEFITYQHTHEFISILNFQLPCDTQLHILRFSIRGSIAIFCRFSGLNIFSELKKSNSIVKYIDTLIMACSVSPRRPELSYLVFKQYFIFPDLLPPQNAINSFNVCTRNRVLCYYLPLLVHYFMLRVRNAK